MDQVEDRFQQLTAEPSKPLIPTANEDRNDEVANNLPVPDSAGDLAHRLTRHALYTILLAIQLFIFPFKLFVRRFIPFLYYFCRGSSGLHNILKKRNTLHTRCLRWSLFGAVTSVWSQVVAIPHKLDRLTTLLEENIELMAMKRGDEQDKTSGVPVVEACSPHDESVIPPLTASALYHAALANNRTLDNLLDSLDGGGARTVSCTSIDEREGTASQRVIRGWAETASIPQSIEPSDAQPFSESNLSSSTSGARQTHDAESPSYGPSSTLKQIQASSLRHRSPIPSISTTTPKSSPSSISSLASRSLPRNPVVSMESQSDTVMATQPRCTACDKSHSDTEHGSDSKGKTTTIQPVSLYRTIPRSKRSAIPRRNGRFLLNHRVRTPL